MDCSPLGSSVPGSPGKFLEWIAIFFSRGSSQPWIEPSSPALQADSLPSEPWGSWEAPSKGEKMTEIVVEFIYNTYIHKYVNKDNLGKDN